MNLQKPIVILSGLFLVFALLCPLSSGAKAPDAEARAALRLQSYIKNRLPPRGLSLDCVDLILEASEGRYYEYAVRERHEGKCGGDPEVAPIVDRYRVPKQGGKIQIYDVVQDAWVKTSLLWAVPVIQGRV